MKTEKKEWNNQQCISIEFVHQEQTQIESQEDERGEKTHHKTQEHF